MTLAVLRGDLWELHARGHWIVVPVNIGWNYSGENNMGAGVAMQTALRFPGMPGWWGRRCRLLGAATPVTPRTGGGRRLILFPVKPLRNPSSMSWDQNASLELIERSARELARTTASPVSLPFVGCGNGGLRPEVVFPILERHLGSPRFTVVDREPSR